MFPNGATAYRKSQVTTASPAQLVAQLYQGAITFTERGVQAMEQRDLEKSHHSLVRAQAIVNHLRATLNRDAGPLALRLDGLYDYFFRRLVLANVSKDPAVAREVLGHLRDLHAAWLAISPSAWSAQPVPVSVPDARPTVAGSARGRG
ncbi:MAG: flagellar export chaperone FliS [Candidatus Dormibacteraceae bacterium]